MKKLILFIAVFLFAFAGYSQNNVTSIKGQKITIPAGVPSGNTMLGLRVENNDASGDAGIMLIVGTDTVILQLDSNGVFYISDAPVHFKDSLYVDGNQTTLTGVDATSGNSTLLVQDNVNTELFKVGNAGDLTGSLVKVRSNTASALAIGSGASDNLAAGNLSIGPDAGGSSSGSQNTYIGKGAGSSSAGNNNFFLGSFAGNASVGGGVTAIGSSAGAGQTGTKSVFIGSRAGLIGASDAAFSVDSSFVAGNTFNPFTHVYFGAGYSAAAPSDWTLHGSGARGTDVAGGTLNMATGLGTGAGISGDFVLQSAPSGGTGSTQNSLVERVRLDGETGYLGIGVVSPTERLEVSGNVWGDTAKFLSYVGHSDFTIGRAGDDITINADTVKGNPVWAGNFDVDTVVANVIGIGTSVPPNPLHVVGSTSAQISFGQDVSNYYNIGRGSATGRFGFSGTQAGQEGYYFTDGNVMLNGAGAGLQWGTSIVPDLSDLSRNAGNGDIELNLQNSANVDFSVLFTHASGGVGINVANPTARLQTSGVDATSGNIALLAQDNVGTNLFAVRDDGKVGIGTITPETDLHVESSADNNMLLSSSGNFVSALYGRSYGGTYASPTATVANAGLLYMVGRGHDGTSYVNSFSSYIGISASQNWTPSAQGSYILFATVPTGTTTSAVRMRIGNNGNIGIGPSAAESTALLDVQSTTKGFLPPRMTSAQRTAIGTPAVGLVVYQTDGGAAEGLYVNTSGGWLQL